MKRCAAKESCSEKKSNAYTNNNNKETNKRIEMKRIDAKELVAVAH